jgi:hypothetical protein
VTCNTKLALVRADDVIDFRQTPGYILQRYVLRAQLAVWTTRERWVGYQKLRCFLVENPLKEAPGQGGDVVGFLKLAVRRPVDLGLVKWPSGFWEEKERWAGRRGPVSRGDGQQIGGFDRGRAGK